MQPKHQPIGVAIEHELRTEVERDDARARAISQREEGVLWGRQGEKIGRGVKDRIARRPTAVVIVRGPPGSAKINTLRMVSPEIADRDQDVCRREGGGYGLKWRGMIHDFVEDHFIVKDKTVAGTEGDRTGSEPLTIAIRRTGASAIVNFDRVSHGKFVGEEEKQFVLRDCAKAKRVLIQ